MRKSILLLLAASILWSTGGLLIKLVNLPPLALAGYRGLFTACFLFLFVKKSAFSFSWNKALGALSYAAVTILCVAATKHTTAASAILLQYTSPIYIAILGGLLLKEKSTLRDWMMIFFVLSGMVLFFLDDIGSSNLTGNLMGALSGVAMAFNTIFMRREKEADPVQNVFWGSILTVIITSPFMSANIPGRESWTGLALLGIFQLGLAYLLYSMAIKNIPALQATLICLVEPLLNPLWVYLTIGELPGGLSILGGIIILAFVTLNSLNMKKAGNPA
jgi:drug/metabolite transporter (DMT)-like permease